MRTRNLLFFCLGLLSTAIVSAQPAERLVKVHLAPEHADWQYKPGEKVKFNVSVAKNDIQLKDVEIRYEVSEDMMPPLKKESLVLKDGKAVIDAGTLKTPGFLRCQVYAKYEGKEYGGTATAGFEPEKVQPTIGLPADFLDFWDKAKADAAKIPLDARVTLLPERCTEKVNVYHVNLQNYRYGTRLYGIVCVPKAPKKYPAILKVPGAGIRSYYGDVNNAEKGIITFEIGIHGIPVNLTGDVYANLDRGALSGYHSYRLEDKDQYYYKRVYLGCVRAIDFIYSLPEFDGTNLAVCGGSQGGALSIVTAGLDSRVKCLVSFYPALCDVSGYLYGRAGGWPHMFRGADKKDQLTAIRLATAQYYDVVNFARQVKVPGFYSFGFNDMVCPPTTTYSAYNVLNAPKTLMLVEETAHWTYPEQWEKAWAWMFEQLK
ncbi:cephalosporin deacetylase [Bacteroidia bacterium]|nr:cephalosporin deacetylase [Bacteroidia bacterium]